MNLDLKFVVYTDCGDKFQAVEAGTDNGCPSMGEQKTVADEDQIRSPFNSNPSYNLKQMETGLPSF